MLEGPLEDLIRRRIEGSHHAFMRKIIPEIKKNLEFSANEVVDRKIIEEIS